MTEAPCRAHCGVAAAWCCIVCSVWHWAALCSSCPHRVPTLICAVSPGLLPPPALWAGLGMGLPLCGLLVPKEYSWWQIFVTELLQSLSFSFQHWLEFTKSVVKQMRGKHCSQYKQNTEQCPAGRCMVQLGVPHPCRGDVRVGAQPAWTGGGGGGVCPEVWWQVGDGAAVPTAQPPFTMCFRVKFYPTDPAALKEEITR